MNHKEELAQILHGLFCEGPHSDYMEDVVNDNDPKCHYYLETSLTSQWEERDHSKWLTIADRFVADQMLANEAEAILMIQKMTSAIRNVNEFLSEYPRAKNVILKLLG